MHTAHFLAVGRGVVVCPNPLNVDLLDIDSWMQIPWIQTPLGRPLCADTPYWQTPLPPVNRQTGVEMLPFPKLRLRAKKKQLTWIGLGVRQVFPTYGCYHDSYTRKDNTSSDRVFELRHDVRKFR